MSNPIQFPSEGFIRLSQLLQMVPISRVSLWRKIKAGEFPKPHMLGPRTRVWDIEKIRAWKEHFTAGPDNDND